MSNRAERRAAARLTTKAAAVQAKLDQLQQLQQQQQPQSNPAVMTAAAAAGSCSPMAPDVNFAEPESSNPRPISDAKLAANRANAQKSCGPTSDEGKAKVRLNALKTGLTGQTVLLPSDDTAAYEQHIASFFTRHSPLGDEEHTLVQAIADTEWRLLRIAPLESGIYAIGRLKLADLHPEQTDPVVREGLIRTEISSPIARNSTISLSRSAVSAISASPISKPSMRCKSNARRRKKRSTTSNPKCAMPSTWS